MAGGDHPWQGGVAHHPGALNDANSINMRVSGPEQTIAHIPGILADFSKNFNLPRLVFWIPDNFVIFPRSALSCSPNFWKTLYFHY